MEQKIVVTQNDIKGLKVVASKEIVELNQCAAEASGIIKKL